MAFPGAGLDQWVRRTKSAFWLRAADRVGKNAYVRGRPYVVNAGTLLIGDDFELGSRPAPSHLVVMPGGRIELGNRVFISYGAAISSQLEVHIGDETQLGPFAVIMDSDFHVAGDRNAIALPAPVRVGRRVVLGSRVTVLRGSTIGDDARVLSGSVVSGNVPAGAVVGGVPAKAAGETIEGEGANVAKIVARVLGLADLPGPLLGPAEISAWDSLGSLKILLALEDAFDISISEQELASARSIARLEEIVEAARRVKPSLDQDDVAAAQRKEGGARLVFEDRVVGEANPPKLRDSPQHEDP